MTDDENDKKSRKILIELENIDDDCDDIGIDFVKISDEGIAQEYDIASMPAIVYFRHRFPQIYEGMKLEIFITSSHCIPIKFFSDPKHFIQITRDLHLPIVLKKTSTHSSSIITGDMTDEEAVLEWLIDNKDKGPASIIEEVDGKMLQSLVDTFEFLVVYFCE